MKNKVCIVCFWDRAATPYLEKYERVLREQGIEFDVIFWDRGNNFCGEIKTNERYIKIKIAKYKFFKIVSFLKWKQLITKMILRGGYTELIILTTYPAVLLSRFLLKNFRNRYIFDIRDYSMEENKYFRRLVMKIVEASSFTTISSQAYLRWLEPSEKIVINHNITGSTEGIQRELILKRNEPLVISFVGTVRLFDHTKAFMLQLKNSKRYILEFVGRTTPDCDIEKFCYDNDIHNIRLKGAFKSIDKLEIYKTVDLVNAVYTNDSLTGTTAIPNRIYDTAIYKAPIICSSRTYLAELVQRYGLGIPIDAYDMHLEEKLDAYVDNFDERYFLDGCKKFIDNILKEEDVFLSKLKCTLDVWMAIKGSTDDLL